MLNNPINQHELKTLPAGPSDAHPDLLYVVCMYVLTLQLITIRQQRHSLSAFLLRLKKTSLCTGKFKVLMYVSSSQSHTGLVINILSTYSFLASWMVCSKYS